MSGVTPEPSDLPQLCLAELLANALLHSARRQCSNPGVVILALAKGLGRAIAEAGPGEDPAALLAAAISAADRTSQHAQMEARLQAAGILAVHDAGHA